ncbi:TIR domain-containing protein [Marinicauda sp. Alg238-R41]|uniref:TIR domain-containing protein n=1 Tax=Marinicauda sp. Alg238-R41 TaxID=2993447 RepID=UPI003FA560A3
MYEKRLFISHSWTYSEPYLSMVRLLANRPYFSFKNFSVPETKAFGLTSQYKLKEGLRQQIRPVHCVIIIGGMWTSHSDWIQFELDFAHSIGKPILGVRPRGAQRMPVAITQKANFIVNWNSDSIVRGVRSIS